MTTENNSYATDVFHVEHRVPDEGDGGHLYVLETEYIPAPKGVVESCFSVLRGLVTSPIHASTSAVAGLLNMGQTDRAADE